MFRTLLVLTLLATGTVAADQPSPEAVRDAVAVVDDCYWHADRGADAPCPRLRRAVTILRRAGRAGIERASAAYGLGVAGALLGAPLAKTTALLELSLELGEVRRRTYEVLARCHRDAGRFDDELRYLEECARQNQLDDVLETALAAAYRRRGTDGDDERAAYYERSAQWRRTTEEERDPAWAASIAARDAAYERRITEAREERERAEREQTEAARAERTASALATDERQKLNLQRYEDYKLVKKVIDGEILNPRCDITKG